MFTWGVLPFPHQPPTQVPPMTIRKTIVDQVLYHLYLNTRHDRYPINLDTHELAAAFGTTSDGIHAALNQLKKQGKIKRVDRFGRLCNKADELSGAQRLVKKTLDCGGTLLYDKKSRMALARDMQIKYASLQRYKTRVKLLPFIHIEYDKTRPVAIHITDMDAAKAYVGKGSGDAKRYGKAYWKYVKGWSKTKWNPKPKPAKPQQKHIKHFVLEYLVAHGGQITGIAKNHAASIGCKVGTFQKAVNRLAVAGVVSVAPGKIQIRDAEKVAFLLAPFTDRQPTTPSQNSPSSMPSKPCTLLKNSNNVTVFISPHPQQQTAVSVLLASIIIRKQLEWQAARLRLFYPVNYEKGQHKLMELYKQIQAQTDEENEVRRQRSGAMYSKQKAICHAILQSLQVHVGLGGPILDPLIEEVIRRLQGALPTVENPNNEAGEAFADWLESALPLDGVHLEWLHSFLENSCAQQLSEFVFRGGVEFLLRIKCWNDADRGVIEQRTAWDIMAYLAYIRQRPYNARYPEQFPVIGGWDGVKTEDSFWRGMIVGEALSSYLTAEYKLNSIETLKPLIVRALCEEYPVKTPEGVVFTSAWDQESLHMGMAVSEEYYKLEEWVTEYQEAAAVNPAPRVEKYSLAWYENKYRAIFEYGFPGDVEAINQKISALKRWPKADIKEQQEKLLPQLNRPTKYDQPMLPWEAWDEIARS